MLYFIAMCTEKPINVCTAYYIKTSEFLIFHIKMLKRNRLKPFLEKMESIVFRTLPFSVLSLLSKKHVFIADQVFR